LRQVGHAREDLKVLHAVLPEQDAPDLRDRFLVPFDVLHTSVHEGDLPRCSGCPLRVIIVVMGCYEAVHPPEQHVALLIEAEVLLLSITPTTR
jgi:hypothetical protein